MRYGIRVKITQSSMPAYWYSDKIGQEFLVSFTSDGKRYVLIQEYVKEFFVPNIKYIDINDTKTIEYVKFKDYFSHEIIFD